MGLLDDAIREHLDLKRRRGADPAEIERAEREALGPVRRAPEEVESDDLEGSSAAYDHQVEEDWGDTTGDESEPEIPEFLAGGPRPLIFEDEGEDAPVAYDERPVADRAGPREPADSDDLRAVDVPPAAERLRVVDDPDEVEEPEYSEPEPREAPGPEPDLRATPAPAPAPAPDALSPEPPPPQSAPAPPAREPVDSDPDPLPGETAEYDVEHALRQERDGEPDAEDPLEETPEFLQDTPDHDRLWFEQRPPKDFDFDG